MGLFRRGTKLLRLGSGLRDCCCRDAPKACFCPSMCRYSYEWSGFDELTDGQQGTNCEISINRDPENGETPFGLASPYDPPILGLVGPILETNFINVGVETAFDLSANGIRFRYSHNAAGQLATPRVFPGTNFVALGVGYRTDLIVALFPFCSFGQLLEGNKFSLNVLLQEQVSVSSSRFGSDEKTASAFLYRNHRRASLEVPGVCIENSLLFCENEDNTEPRLHLAEEIEIEIDSEGFTANGERREFELDFPVIDTGDTSWRVEGRYPFDQTPTVTLKLSDTCQPGICDCAAVLTGVQVEFEGQTFTYGSGEEFFSEDGLIYWYEFSPGLFYKVTRDACDPSQVVRNTRVANVFCFNEGGIDYWAVLLTNECNEPIDCNPALGLQRNAQWSGVFSCNSEGKPSGFPYSAEDQADPPDLEYDITSDPPPEDECAETPEIPSFRFL